jgi:hypothetical protein
MNRRKNAKSSGNRAFYCATCAINNFLLVRFLIVKALAAMQRPIRKPAVQPMNEEHYNGWCA